MTEGNVGEAGSGFCKAAGKEPVVIFPILSTHHHLLLQLLVCAKGQGRKGGMVAQPRQTLKAVSIASQKIKL